MVEVEVESAGERQGVWESRREMKCGRRKDRDGVREREREGGRERERE